MKIVCSLYKIDSSCGDLPRSKVKSSFQWAFTRLCIAFWHLSEALSSVCKLRWAGEWLGGFLGLSLGEELWGAGACHKEQQGWPWVQSTTLVRGGWGAGVFQPGYVLWAQQLFSSVSSGFLCSVVCRKSSDGRICADLWSVFLSVAVQGCILHSLFPFPFISLPLCVSLFNTGKYLMYVLTQKSRCSACTLRLPFLGTKCVVLDDF